LTEFDRRVAEGGHLGERNFPAEANTTDGRTSVIGKGRGLSPSKWEEFHVDHLEPVEDRRRADVLVN